VQGGPAFCLSQLHARNVASCSWLYMAGVQPVVGRSRAGAGVAGEQLSAVGDVETLPARLLVQW
jgi:hypothetical protein